jgi:hypothetical protein
MVISVKFIRKPRLNRRCSACNQMIGPNPLFQFYGFADYGDKAYAIWLHVACAYNWTSSDPKIATAIEKHRANVAAAAGLTPEQPT